MCSKISRETCNSFELALCLKQWSAVSRSMGVTIIAMQDGKKEREMSNTVTVCKTIE